MPQFVGTLEFSPYPDGITWRVDEPFAYVREPTPIKVPQFFQSDFASVPAVFTNVFPRWSTYGPAAIVHDWLYWNQPTPRADADAIFLEAMMVLGVSVWTRQCLYRAVRMFGQSAWDSNAKIAAAGYSRVGTATSDAPEWPAFRQ